jgi:hypothetical protein
MGVPSGSWLGSGRWHVAWVLLLLLAGVSLPGVASAQVDPDWFGTWTLNLDESSYEPGPAPYVRGTCVIVPWGEGVQMVYDLVGVRGGVTHLEWAGDFDDRSYAVQGLDVVMTYSYAPRRERAWDVTVRLDGVTVGTALVTLAHDGRRLTTVTTATGPDGRVLTSTTVYDKAAP